VVTSNEYVNTTGELRRYHYDREKGSWAYDVLISLETGFLQSPDYLTFGKTDPSTLQYLGDQDDYGGLGYHH
jgi:hypothetical protein